MSNTFNKVGDNKGYKSKLYEIAQQLQKFSSDELEKVLGYMNELKCEKGTNEYVNQSDTNSVLDKSIYGVTIDLEDTTYPELQKKFSTYTSAQQLAKHGWLTKDVYMLLDRVVDEKALKDAKKMSYDEFAQHNLFTYLINEANRITLTLGAYNIDHDALFGKKDHNNRVYLWVTAGYGTDIVFMVKIDYSNRESEKKFDAGLFAFDSSVHTAPLDRLCPVVSFNKHQ